MGLEGASWLPLAGKALHFSHKIFLQRQILSHLTDHILLQKSTATHIEEAGLQVSPSKHHILYPFILQHTSDFNIIQEEMGIYVEA